MKTAISIPDEVFRAAERYSKRTGISRSKLYTKAVTEYLKVQRENNVKEILDRIYGAEDSTVDPTLQKMQRVSIPGEKW